MVAIETFQQLVVSGHCEVQSKLCTKPLVFAVGFFQMFVGGVRAARVNEIASAAAESKRVLLYIFLST